MNKYLILSLLRTIYVILSGIKKPSNLTKALKNIILYAVWRLQTDTNDIDTDAIIEKRIEGYFSEPGKKITEFTAKF